MFSFGVKPDEVERTGDGREADTVNRLLLHGARHHDRQATFLQWDAGGDGGHWGVIPDWQADRYSIRAGLALHERIETIPGERAALWLPFCPEWAYIERGAWAVGVVSVPLWPDWSLVRVAEVLSDARPSVLFTDRAEPVHKLRAQGDLPDSLRAIVLLSESGVTAGDDMVSFAKLMEYGGVLDTAERASMLRNTARAVPPEAPLSLEYVDTSSGTLGPNELNHLNLVSAMEGIVHRFPPGARRKQLLSTDWPDHRARAFLYAGWADGLTSSAFARPADLRDRAVRLRPDLIIDNDEARFAGLTLPQLAPEKQSSPGLLDRFREWAKGPEEILEGKVLSVNASELDITLTCPPENRPPSRHQVGNGEA